MLAVRGSDCFKLLQDIIGPSPEIARKTDPNSMNARFSGLEGEVVCSPPARGLVDVAWAFGGRIGNFLTAPSCTVADVEKIISSGTLHGIHVFPEEVFYGGVKAGIGSEDLITRIERCVRHIGRILSINPHAVPIKSDSPTNKVGTVSQTGTFVVNAVREGGRAFVDRMGLFDCSFTKQPMDNYGLKIKKYIYFLCFVNNFHNSVSFRFSAKADRGEVLHVQVCSFYSSIYR